MVIEQLKDMSMEALHEVIESARELMERYEKDRRKGAIREIQELAASAGLEVTIREGGKPIKSVTKGVPKYRNPYNPKETWTGKGKRPQWFLDAIAEGKSQEDLSV